jgi:hypothetical protein
MVSTEASLPTVGLLMVVLLLNDFSPARGQVGKRPALPNKRCSTCWHAMPRARSGPKPCRCR